jgi:hypothetical protein
MSLAQRDFPRPQQRACGRQIHEIKTGDEEYQKADDADAINRGPAAARRFIKPPTGGSQVHVGKGGQVNGPAPASLAMVLVSGLRRNGAIDYGRHLRDDALRLGARRQHDIAEAVAPAIPGLPCLQADTVRNGRVRHEHVTVDLRIVGNVPHDSGDLQGN